MPLRIRAAARRPAEGMFDQLTRSGTRTGNRAQESSARRCRVVGIRVWTL